MFADEKNQLSQLSNSVEAGTEQRKRFQLGKMLNICQL